MKLLIAFFVYPRKNTLHVNHQHLRDPLQTQSNNKSSTYLLLKRTFETLFLNKDFSDLHLEIQIIVIGDDYPNIDELKPIFVGFNVEYYNINKGDALRNKKISNLIKWQQAVQRSQIFALEKALEKYPHYDYLMISADDERYIGDKIRTTINYIRTYGQTDFVFCLGKHNNGQILPRSYDAKNLTKNYPQGSDCISSGTLYKIQNKIFITALINQRKKKWNNVLDLLKGRKHHRRIEPEDKEIWDFLHWFFQKGIFTSLLIPEVLIDHDTQGTLSHYS